MMGNNQKIITKRREITTMKIGLLATGLAYYLDNRQYLTSHKQPLSSLNATMKILGDEERYACPEDDCSCEHDHDDVPSPSSHSDKENVTGREIVVADKLSDLAKILEEDVQLVMWKQQSTPTFVKALNDQSIAPENLPSFEGMVPALPGLVEEIIKKHIFLPYDIRSRPNVLSESEADEMAQHIDTLVQLFADVAIKSGFIEGKIDGEVDEIPYVHVKIQVMTTDGCRFWHQDSVPFRLVSTLRGPCTEWVPPEYSTPTLKRRQSDSKHARSMDLNDVALFKGRGDEEVQTIYGLPGIVHRSPRVEESGESRVVLIIDIPQEGWHFD